MTKEIWTTFRNTNYSISNTGLIRNNKTNRILKQHVNMWGYYIVKLCDGYKCKTYKTHQLVAEIYLNHTPCKHTYVVNHIDHNRLNNNISNLEIVTMRENTNKLHLKSTSKYTGVSLQKKTNRWLSYKMINNKHTYLGIFDDEELAHQCYLNN